MTRAAIYVAARGITVPNIPMPGEPFYMRGTSIRWADTGGPLAHEVSHALRLLEGCKADPMRVLCCIPPEMLRTWLRVAAYVAAIDKRHGGPVEEFYLQSRNLDPWGEAIAD